MELIIKGIIIGIGKILPGISGSLLAMTLGIYDKIKEKISNYRKDIINNTKYLSKIGLGITISITILSKIIVKCINKHYFATMLLFIGMIVSQTPEIIKKMKPRTKKNNIMILITTTIILLITLTLNPSNTQQLTTIKFSPIEILKLILIGILDSIASIIPGISGTAILINIGYYEIIITTFSNITKLSQINTTILILIPFITGFTIGMIYISKIINKILNRNKNIINILTIIFTTTTTLLLIKQTFQTKHSPQETITGISLLIIVIITTRQINKKRINKKKKYII